MVTFLLIVLLGLCCLGVVMPEEQNCGALEFPDPMLGTLKPCSWPKARGMLCMSDFPDIVVWPGAKESEQLKACGFNSSDQSLDETYRFKRNLSNRRKREAEFNAEFRGTDFDFRQILAELIKMDFGRRGKVELDMDEQFFIDTKVRLEHNREQGVYRTLMGPEDQFDPDQAGVKARDTLLRLLRDKKDRSNWDWLNMDRIAHELAICFYADYSTITNQDIRFQSPERNQLIEPGTNASRSTFDYWYYKLSCIRDEGKVYLATVIYTDSMRLADVERSVEYWENHPETVVKYANEYRQRLVESIQTVVAKDTRVERGESCYIKKKRRLFRRTKKTRICHPWANQVDKNRVFNLLKQTIAQDVTPQKFQYEVNNWVKNTKEMMVGRSLNLKEREALKDWIGNVVLERVLDHFSQFFNTPNDINSITATEEEETTSEEDFNLDDF